MEHDFELILQTFQQLKNRENVKAYLLELVENLSKDLKQSQECIKTLQESLLKLTQSVDFGIKSKFFALQEDYKQLLSAKSDLAAEIRTIQSLNSTREADLKAAHLSEKEAIENHFKELLQRQNEEKHVEVENQEKKIADLMNEITVVSASYSMEMQRDNEQNRNQIASLQKKLKESCDTSSTLRCELRKKNQKIAELEEKLRASKNQTRNTTTTSPAQQSSLGILDENDQDLLQPQVQRECESPFIDLSAIIDIDVGNAVAEPSKNTTKYQSLATSTIASSKPAEKAKDVGKKFTTPTVYRSNTTFKSSLRKNFLPPLKPMSDSKSNVKSSKEGPKRRKLYDPTNYDHLQEVE